MYVRPQVHAVAQDVAACMCNFWTRNTSGSQCGGVITPSEPIVVGGATVPCVSVQANPNTEVDPSAITLKPLLTNTVVGVDDSGARVTPLAGTGLPGTAPVLIGVPVGTRGVYLDVGLTKGAYALDTANGFGVDVAGTVVLVSLP